MVTATAAAAVEHDDLLFTRDALREQIGPLGLATRRGANCSIVGSPACSPGHASSWRRMAATSGCRSTSTVLIHSDSIVRQLDTAAGIDVFLAVQRQVAQG